MVDFLEYCASSGELIRKRRQEKTKARTGCLGRDALEDVVDKAVQDGHGFVRDTGVGVDLLEDCTNVNASTRQTRRHAPL
jgi:hypothetical protein